MMTMKHWIWFPIFIPKMNKASRYQKYADYIASLAVSTGFEWMAFLDTMAQNSNRSIPELLLIHFQRPEACDCRTYQEWLKSGCQVRRGAIGIAVPDKSNPEKMQYLFGRADIKSSSGNDRYWKFLEKFETDAAHALEKNFDTGLTRSFYDQVEYAVSTAMDDYWAAHETEILGAIMDCVKGWGEYSAKLQFMDAVYFSACYLILQRCDKNPKFSYYESDFLCVRDFSSPKAMITLGEAVRVVGNRVLEVIEKTIVEQKLNSIQAEGPKMPPAFFKPKSNKNEMEV